jgi:hypothetical protein
MTTPNPGLLALTRAAIAQVKRDRQAKAEPAPAAEKPTPPPNEHAMAARAAMRGEAS